MSQFLEDLVHRWFVEDSSARVVESSLEADPLLPAAVLLVGAVVLWLLAVPPGFSRRLDLNRSFRWILAVLRTLALLVPVLVLARPQLLLKLERSRPREIAILLDGSGSMGVRDSPGPYPASRWEGAVQAVGGLIEKLGALAADGETSAAASLPRQGAALTGSSDSPRLRIRVFDVTPRAIPPDALLAMGPPRPDGRTALGDALDAIRAELVSRPAPMVFILSDGADNASTLDPLEAARKLLAAGIPIHACIVGNERPRDLKVSAAADAPFAYAGDPVPIRLRLEHEGFDGGTATARVLEEDPSGAETILASRDIALPSGREPAREILDLRFTSPGRKACRVVIEPLPGELTVLNNAADLVVQVIDDPLRVLYVEKWPRWQYRFLSSAMRLDRRLEASVVLLTEDSAAPPEERQGTSFPRGADELSRFDAVVLGDLAPQDLPLDSWKALEDHVVRGGAGLVLAAGTQHNPRDFQDLPIRSLLSFERVDASSEEDTSPWRPRLTALGLEHALVRMGSGNDPAAIWKDLPALEWAVTVRDLKPGALVLAERPGEGGGDSIPLVILQRVGRGSVLFMGTDETWKWRYQTGNLRFYGFWGQAIQHVGMPRRIEGLGLRGEAQSAAEKAPDPELSSPSVEPDTLRRVAALTGGQCVAVDRLPELVSRLDVSPLRQRWLERASLWDGWLFLAFLTIVLTLEWCLRKWRFLP